MSVKRVFLTGASGNVGAAVLAELVRRELDVVALVRKTLPAQTGYRPIFGDLAGIRDVAAEVLQADAIIHCASPRTDQRQQALREDIEGTAQLLDLWQGGPFVFASSQTVYGIPQGVLREDDPPVASGWYDLAKICNEQQVQMSAHANGRGAGISLRLPLVFAAGPRRRDRQYLAVLFDALKAGKTFLFGSDEALETIGSVYAGERDLGRAFAAALGVETSGAFNMAGGFCTWRELLETLGRAAGIAPRFLVRADTTAREGEFRLPQSRSFYDCSRFEAATGFAPAETLDDVIAKFVAAERGTR